MADLSGERLGPFEIHSLIGTGGFATVYRAHDPRLGTDVALKILAENHSLDPTIRERFLGEANALRRVDSSAVIRIFDIRETPDARPYLVLEFADRGDLVGRRRSQINNGWTPEPADVLSLVESLAEALDAVHAEDLVHRDITPSNVLIRSGSRTTARPGVAVIQPDERLMLSDMGLVKDLSAGSSLTVGGGTAGFWAPEQQQAMASVDHRTDIYSATALTVWFLTGGTVATDPTWDNTVRSLGWPEAFVSELQRGLSIDPDGRHQTAREWEAALAVSLHDTALLTPVPAADVQPAEPGGPADAITRPAEAPTFYPASESAAPSDAAVAVPESSTGDAVSVPKNALAAVGALLAIAALIGFFLLRGGSADGEAATDDPATTDSQTEQTQTEQTPSEATQGDGAQTDDIQADDTQTGENDAESGQPATAQPGELAVGDIDTWHFTMTDEGAQLIVERVLTTPQSTVVEFSVVNARHRDLRLQTSFRTARLVANGQTYELLEESEIELKPGERGDFPVVFEPLRNDPDSLAIEINVLNGALQNNGFIIEDVRLEPAVSPPLPESLIVGDGAFHPIAATVWVSEVAFSETHMAVGFVGANGSGSSAAFVGGSQETLLEDDLGNRYWARLADDERILRIGEDQVVTGTMVFAGRIHPDATSLRLVVNESESLVSTQTSVPKFELGPWALDGSDAAPVGLPQPINPGERQLHPNQTDVTVNALGFGPAAIDADLSVRNGYRLTVRLAGCCDHTYLLDDLGNRYLVEESTRDLGEIESGGDWDGTFTFIGTLHPAAAEVTVVINDRDEGGIDDPATGRPEFRFGPYAIERDAPQRDTRIDPDAFGTTSSLEISSAVES